MPTLTTSANGAGTQISGGVAVANNNAAIKYSADMKVAGGTYPDYTAIRGFSVNYGTGRQANLTRAAFYYDGTDIEIQIIGSGDTSFRLYVDGQIANESASVTADGGFYRHKITFASAAKRLIEWEFNAYTKIVEFRRNPTATLWACPRNVRAIFLGDTITEGPSGAFAQTSKAYAPLCGRMLGWDDTWISGVGSTGYVAAPGGKLPLKDRISTDVAPYNPDVVVVAMGINDSDALTEATVLETLTAIRGAIAPDAPIFVFGAWNPKSIPMATRNAKIKSAAEKVTLCFYVDDTFFTGTGRSGATVGDGNSDFYVFTDNTHPTQSGAEYLAIRCATGIAAICANL
jgi:lysophospholipase L1-like esterase